MRSARWFRVLPGVILGAVIRVFAIPGADAFRLVAAAVLLPLEIWLCARALRTGTPDLPPLSQSTILGLDPRPHPDRPRHPGAQIAPAALASTFLASIVGAGTYGILALTTTGDIAPHRILGLLCGAGGLIGLLSGRNSPVTADNCRIVAAALAPATSGPAGLR
ncbi:hypothetical protein [Micromonospora lupini]|uniref:hypothetical protein n=1 Tax=Micromonospora lupini TaxID=285679 RepID=UPI0031D2455C